MPTNLETPKIPDFLQAFGDAIRSEGDNLSDIHRGSGFDLVNGISSVIWSREAQNDDDKWASIYFDSADGDQLTDLVSRRFGLDRILDTPGRGYILVRRNGSSLGTFWTGSRIFANDGLEYEIASDYSSSASSDKVPIRSVKTGTGVSLTTSSARFVDPLWDNWTIDYLYCEDGTSFESSPDLRARVRQTRTDTRVGYQTRIVDTLKSAGASNVFLFESNYAGDANDFGLNVCYVSDSKFVSPTSLLNDCRIAADSVRVAGDNLQVLGMAAVELPIVATVNLIDSPSKFNLVELTALINGALFTYFKGQDAGFSFDLVSMSGAIQDVSDDIQFATITTPTAGVSLLSGSPPNLPQVLTKYKPSSNSILLNFAGPV